MPSYIQAATLRTCDAAHFFHTMTKEELLTLLFRLRVPILVAQSSAGYGMCELLVFLRQEQRRG